VKDVTAALKEWEQAHQEDIRKLVALLNRILRVTRNWGGSSTIQHNAGGDMVVKRTVREKMLPEDLYHRWTGAACAGLA
jgi:hypothetical protein